MESFFIIILPPGIYHKKDTSGCNFYAGESAIEYQDLEKIVSQFFYPIHKKGKGINIMNKYALKFCFHTRFIQDITMESCLYYLKNDKETIKNILSVFIKNNFSVFHPGFGYLENLNNFVETLELFYEIKMKIFIEKYNHIFIGKDILPKDFYKILRHN
ncbi:MAG: hypothetical protein LBG90_00890 [Spirochaetaceae bacterium]|nr:hypothetical protein [Spirochaetaceae bacterium]